MLHRHFRFILVGLMFTTVPIAGSVAAQDVTEADVAAYRAALSEDFAMARTLADPADSMIQDLITWQRLRWGNAPFRDFVDFAMKRPDWPGMDTVRARGEEAIEKGTDPALVKAWFTGIVPETGEGAVRLAEALVTTGNPDEAKAVIAQAWTTLRLTEGGQAAIMSAFTDVVIPLHNDRVDMLLWKWRTAEALRMLPLLDSDRQAWVKARVGFIRKTGNEAARLEGVTDTLRDTAGLDYDRYNWLAGKGQRSDAIEILRKRSTSADALGEPFRWSGWRRSLARWQMRDGSPELAYELAANHYMTAEDGASFTDLEWLSGYLKLRYFDDPAQALVHFKNASTAAVSPISAGRTGYWEGRAYDDLGQTIAAREAYLRAAKFQTSFYGLLAAEKLGLSLDATLTGADDPQDWQNSDILADDKVRAGFTLLAAGERGKAILFFADLGRTLGARDLSRLGAALAAQDQSYFAVLIGKAAATRGLVVPSAYYPLHDMTKLELPVPMSLALSIARRESEFYIGAGSPVGAQGLMQLMPGTAREVAGQMGLSYNQSRLTTDWEYNARLGSHYLAGLRDRFGDSPVLMAAGYNAGPSRPIRWVDERGDPRLGQIDVVDWIEHIPFRETRNYVQRVTESIPIYEARLTGLVNPIRFTDLLRGQMVRVRPQLRPQVATDNVVTLDGDTTDTISTQGPITAGPVTSGPVTQSATAPRVGISAPSGPPSTQRPLGRPSR